MLSAINITELRHYGAEFCQIFFGILGGNGFSRKIVLEIY
jgi:hypothetical protein